MSGLGTGSVVVQQSFPNEPASPGFPILKNPRKEYVVGGPWNGWVNNGGYLFAGVIDEVVRQFGPHVYELMETDDAVDASLYLLKAAIFADGLQLRPACDADPGEDMKAAKRSRRRDVKLAGQILEYCERSIHGLDPECGINEELWQLADCMQFGRMLAEQVLELSETGDDRGKEVPTKLHTKPRWSWSLRVNAFMDVLAIRAWTVEGWKDVDPAKFCHAVWRPKEGDPRGTSILRPAFQPWNAKLETYRDHREFLKHFADPSLVITAGEKQQSKTEIDPDTGAVAEKTPAEQNLEAGEAFRNRSILSLPFGATAKLMEQVGNGQVYELAFDRWDRSIFRAIMRSARPMQEAKHGSKADTDSGVDLFQMAVQSARHTFTRAVRRGILYHWVERNWGTEIAKRLTPHVSFGLSDSISSELITAYTQAWNGGVFQLPQRPWLLHKLGAPADPEDYTPVQKGVTDVTSGDQADEQQGQQPEPGNGQEQPPAKGENEEQGGKEPAPEKTPTKGKAKPKPKSKSNG